MITYRSISLTDIAYFRSARLDLDWRGVTFVAGLNRNAGAGERRNGVGKSLLLAPLHHLAFGDPAGLPRSLARHSLLTDPTSRIDWELDADGTSWSISKLREGRSLKWIILRDGEDVEPRTATLAEGMVADLLPFSEDEFASLAYLDSRRPSPLLMGSGAARQTHLSGLLRLDGFDRMREWVGGRLKESNRLASERDGLAQALPEMEPDIKALRKRLAKAEERLESEAAELERINRDLRRRRLHERHRADLEASKGFDLDEWERVKGMEAAMADHVRILDGIKRAERRAAEWRKGVARLAREIGWDGTGSVAEWAGSILADLRREAKAADALAARRSSLESSIKALRRDRDRARSQWERLGDGGSPKRLKRSLESELADAKAGIAAIDEAVAHLEGHLESGASSCPTCGSRLTPDAARLLLDAARDRRERAPALRPLEDRLAAVNSVLDRWGPRRRKSLAALEGELGSLAEPGDAADLRRRADLAAELAARLRSAPDPIPEAPEAPQADMSLDAARDWLADSDAKFRAWASVKAVIGDVRAGARLPPSEELEERRSELMARVDDLAARAAKARARLDGERRSAKRTRRIKARIARMDDELKDRPVLARLSDAYGSKGLRRLALADAVDRICSNLNRFAPLLFAERMSFSAEVGTGGIGIAAVRSDGRTSDIRHLSGAESRLFSLAWLLSVLPMVPAERRSNLVVLDEFEANLDAPARRLLIDEYLPALNEIVDHVIFITPNEPPEPGVGRRTALVVKDGDQSTLEIIE